MLDGVCCTYALLHIRVELWIFLFFCLVFNSYNWGILPVTVFCSFVWYLTPIIEVFCLLLFSVLLFGIQLLLLRYSACYCFLFFSYLLIASDRTLFYSDWNAFVGQIHHIESSTVATHDLIIHYGISVLQMTMYIIRLSNWQSGPFRYNDLLPAI